MSRFTAMGEMASTLAHELNQPLTAVASYLNGCRRLLERGDAADMALLRDGVERAAEQALRAGQIIRRLRDFVARGETERRAENLPKLIEEASALALVGARESRGAGQPSRSTRTAASVLADKVQVQQVLLNLIRNAMEAMEETERRETGGCHRRAAADGHGARSASPIPGRGIAPDMSGAAVPALRHDQAAGHGGGAVGLAHHRRGAWRQALG